MERKPKVDSPAQSFDAKMIPPNNPKRFLSNWRQFLVRIGMGENVVRIATNILAVFLVVVVALLLQKVALGRAYGNPDIPDATPISSIAVQELPVPLLASFGGISRQAELHTTIPNRPRIEVVKYTVQEGDSIFKIAEKFGLKPTTILFGNYSTLKDHPELLKASQELNILPVDGMYYEWQGVENLNQVAETYGTDVESIINYPGNHIDSDTIGNLSNPAIPAGTWLILPGGKREFTSWTAPPVLVYSNPSVHVWGEGVCTGISYVQVGFGYFVYPTTEHWLSGTPFRPDLRHNGVDFAGDEGNAVYAADAGTVVYSGWNTWGYGNLVIIDHGNGWQSLYAHLSGINVGCGQNVGQGDLIGLIGMTGGTSSGPHLHFELLNTQLGYVNPLDYLPAP